MEIIDGYVDWNPGYDQKPDLHAVVKNDPPALSDYTFQPDMDKQFWWAKHPDGYYRYFAGHPDKPGGRTRGDSYTLPTENGEITLIGPYSSRAGIVNKLGHGPCVDVRLHVGNKNGRTHITTISLEHAKQAAEHANIDLYKDYRDSGEFTYRIHQNYPGHWQFETPRQSLTHRDLTIRHPDGTTITVTPTSWTHERKRFNKTTTLDRTTHHAVLKDERGNEIDHTHTRRIDVGVHYLMAQHDDRDPPRKAANAPKETEELLAQIEKSDDDPNIPTQ